MPGSVIGIRLPLGYVGTVSTSADNIIQARIAKGNISFGEPVVLLDTNEYQSVKEFIAGGGTFDAGLFAGVAVREVVQANTFDPQSNPDFLDGGVADVLSRGQMTVACNAGVPVAGGSVFVRIAEGADPDLPVGGLEAAAEGATTVELTNVEWTTGVTNNGIAEITIKTRNKA